MIPPALFAQHNIYWELPILIAVVSLVYSATRFDRWDHIFREAFRWGVRMVLFLLGIVLILQGLALDEASVTLRGTLIVVGLVLEVIVLFIK